MSICCRRYPFNVLITSHCRAVRIDKNNFIIFELPVFACQVAVQNFHVSVFSPCLFLCNPPQRLAMSEMDKSCLARLLSPPVRPAAATFPLLDADYNETLLRLVAQRMRAVKTCGMIDTHDCL